MRRALCTIHYTNTYNRESTGEAMALKTGDVIVSSMHEAVLVDGGPNNYDKYASTYEKDHETYKGHKIVFDKWFTWNEEKLKLSSEKQVCFDAGCGTGLVGALIVEKCRAGAVELYGGDLSQEMLKRAKDKNAYVDLKVVNLKEELPYDSDFFDCILCAGVFLQGHCGPETIPHMMRVLKKNGYLFASIRKAFYDTTKEEWDKKIAESGCKIVDHELVPYFGDMLGVRLVIQKL